MDSDDLVMLVIFLCFAGAVLYILIRSIMIKPDNSGFNWGGFFWGPIYYLIYGMTTKGLILCGIAIGGSLITLGYGAILIGPCIWIYCGVKAHDDWLKSQKDSDLSIKKKQIEEIELNQKIATLSNSPASPMKNGSDGLASKLEELKCLHDKNLITDKEFEKKRKDLIDRY